MAIIAKENISHFLYVAWPMAIIAKLNISRFYIVALCGWPAKADESVLARNQTKDSWT